MIKRGILINEARMLVLGFTFKENCPDLRNTGVSDVIGELKDYGCQVDVHDPLADQQEALHEYGINLVHKPVNGVYDGVLIAVVHDEYREMGVRGVRAYGKQNHILYDLKCLLPLGASDCRL